MEEILASIRRIITEDAENAGKASATAGEQDILELTQKVEADGSVVPVSPRQPPPDEAAPAPAAVAVEEPPVQPAPAPAALQSAGEEPTERLVSDSVAAASVAALSSLARAASPAAPGEPLAGNRVLEEATRELLKPLLKTWLDAHLPALIERIVREEIARLAREARGG